MCTPGVPGAVPGVPGTPPAHPALRGLGWGVQGGGPGGTPRVPPGRWRSQPRMGGCPPRSLWAGGVPPGPPRGYSEGTHPDGDPRGRGSVGPPGGAGAAGWLGRPPVRSRFPGPVVTRLPSRKVWDRALGGRGHTTPPGFAPQSNPKQARGPPFWAPASGAARGSIPRWSAQGVWESVSPDLTAPNGHTGYVGPRHSRSLPGRGYSRPSQGGSNAAQFDGFSGHGPPSPHPWALILGGVLGGGSADPKKCRLRAPLRCKAQGGWGGSAH